LLYVLVLGFWKPWTKSYAEEGKNLARKEDLTEILDEVRAVAQAQQAIRARIDGELWNEQLRTTQKGDLYADLLKAIHKLMTDASGLTNLLEYRAKQPWTLQDDDSLNQRIYESKIALGTTFKELIRSWAWLRSLLIVNV
jgi:hypothetical protein